MEQDAKKQREEELDRFWDIDALIPKRNKPQPVRDTEVTEIVLDPPKQTMERSSALSTSAMPCAEAIDRDAPKRHFIPPHTEYEETQRPKPLCEYTPDNALIRQVRIYPWKSHYRYYEGFLHDAEKLWSVQGAECPRVPFFSYVPQYSQMNRAQLEWYLWWRTGVRRGQFADTDYSYLLLYAYELINLSHKIDPTDIQRALCDLWLAYRNTFHQLDSYLPDWICDHSLIHRLTPPASCTGEHLSAVMAHCALKEFYVPSGGEDGYVRALLAFCSNYHYRKSKFCTGEHTALFDRVIMGAVKEVSAKMSVDGKLFAAAKMDDSRLLRDAYSGALCAYPIKRRIEVEFCSFSRSHELRFFITDVVKYTENRIRAYLGVRSRLTVYALSSEVRALLDSYLDGVLPRRSPTAKKAEEPAEYEKLYDLPKHELSLSNAAEIERVSWDTTERLVEAFTEKESEKSHPAEIPPQTEATHPTQSIPVPPSVCNDPTVVESDFIHTVAVYLPFLRAVSESDGVGQRSAAQALGLPAEVVADEINALAADHFGDILLEEGENGFAVIEDYREELEILLSGNAHGMQS